MTKMIFIISNSMTLTSLFWGHSCLLGSKQDKKYKMYIFFFLYLMTPMEIYFFFLIYDKINKSQMSMNYNLRTVPITMFQSLLSRPITNCECSPSFHITSFLQTLSFLSGSTAVASSLMVLIMPHLPQNMYSRKWKYDLGISNLKLQFKDHFFFFFLSWEPDKCNRLGRMVS